ncbi:MAG: FtsH protease activity modulator HflK [Bacillota bacterium]
MSFDSQGPPWRPRPAGKTVQMPQVPRLRLPKLPLVALVVPLLLVYLASGIYTVQPDEQGVVRRFGALSRVSSPGINYHLPWPFESVVTPKVTEVKRIEIGFRTIKQTSPAQYEDHPEESLMLTGDENIVDAEIIVQWRIKDAAQYLFKVLDVESALRDAAEAALRQVVGSRQIDDVLTVAKAEIQEETRLLLQDIIDRYEAGVQVVAIQLQDVQPPAAVRDAFKDVASAREDRAKLINEAEGYRNDVIPRARGEAEQVIRQAEAYRAERVARAEGETQRFLAMLEEYQKAPGVTRTRLYLEMMEAVLPGVTIYILDESGSTLRFLPLNEGVGRR